MKFISSSVFFSSTLFIFATSVVAKAPTEIGVDAYAQELFQKVAASYADRNQVAVDCITVMKIKTRSQVTYREMRQRLSFSRPDKFSLRHLPGSAPTNEIFYSKRKGLIALPGIGIIERNMSSLERFFRSPQFGYDQSAETNRLMDQNFCATLLRELLVPQKNDRWDKHIVGFELLKPTTDQDPNEIGIRIRQKNKSSDFEFDVWITNEANPKILKFRPSLKLLNESNRRRNIEYLAYEGTFENWQFSEIQDDAFQVPATESRRYTSIQQATSQAALKNQQSDFQLRDHLIGRQIDDAKVNLVDGTEQSLLEMSKDKILVLDFWASWSSMCVDAIPKWRRLLEDEKYSDVVYLPVNQGQSPEVVQQFLEDQNWDGQFALDPNRQLGHDFGVTAIPQTVIVDDEGRVAKLLFRVRQTGDIRKALDSVVAPANKPADGLETLEQLRAREKKVVQVVEKVSPTVVGLQIRNGGGSGVIINKEGLVLTAAHVTLEAGVNVRVFLANGEQVAGKSLGANHRRDSAMIQLEGDREWPFAEVAEKDSKKGDWIVTMGHPGGYDFVTDRTAPVRIGRVVKLPNQPGAGRGFLGTDCTITQGDSGGPAFDLDGRVVGIHSFISTRLIENMHVPISAFHEDWDRMKDGLVWGRGGSHGRTQGRPRMGVVLDETENGVVVKEVKPDTPAEKAGLQQGDVIKSLGGLKEIKDLASLRQEMRRYTINDRIKMVLLRDDKTVEVEINLKGGQ